MNNHRFMTIEKEGKLKLSYHLYKNIWRMSGGKFGEHFISTEYDGRYQSYDSRNARVAAHWSGYKEAQAKARKD
jgi:phosphopantetheinyl transferase (holo-ACP synthase)